MLKKKKKSFDGWIPWNYLLKVTWRLKHFILITWQGDNLRQSQTVHDVVELSMRGISRMSWTVRLILVTWSRPNLIIGLIFPVGKKGQLGKKILFNMFNVWQVYTGFLLPNYQHVSYTAWIKHLGRVKYYVTSALMFINMSTLAH